MCNNLRQIPYFIKFMLQANVPGFDAPKTEKLALLVKVYGKCIAWLTGRIQFLVLINCQQ